MTDGSASQFIIYQTEDGQTKLDVRFVDETVWLSQQQMAELFQTSRTNIVEHVSNVYAEGELLESATCREFRQVRIEGRRQVTRALPFYNLDMVLSVGYRVKTVVATRFRQWATQQLREFIVKGFLLDDDRLKNPDQPFDYFEELTRRIQDIRTSEKRFYQKITDIYATSVDYDPTLDTSIQFFKTVQNKVHWAITGQTAAEIIYHRADSRQQNMGLTHWRGVKVRKQDVVTAKNYLNVQELQALNNLVEQYLVFAEGQAMRRIPMAMFDWIKKLDGFLTLNDRDILTHAGKISHDMAKQLAEQEYDKFHHARLQTKDSASDDSLIQLTHAAEQLSKSKARPTNDNHLKGVTLIELMIALLIISILLAVAVPTYQQHIVKNHREYAKAALSDVGAQIARLRTRSANANLPNAINPQTLLATPLSRYQLQLSPNPIANAPLYWLTAIPVDPAQQGNGGLTLSSDGRGCWHQGNDQPTGYVCGVGSKVW